MYKIIVQVFKVRYVRKLIYKKQPGPLCYTCRKIKMSKKKQKKKNKKKNTHTHTHTYTFVLSFVF